MASKKKNKAEITTLNSLRKYFPSVSNYLLTSTTGLEMRLWNLNCAKDSLLFEGRGGAR